MTEKINEESCWEAINHYRRELANPIEKIIGLPPGRNYVILHPNSDQPKVAILDQKNVGNELGIGKPLALGSKLPSEQELSEILQRKDHKL